MSYIGAEPTTAAFPFDQFSGNGTTTAFTLTYAPASTTSIIVAISGVVQNPNLYSVIGTTLTFSPAPPTGTNNISVLYLGLPVIGVSSPGNTAYFSSTTFTATGGQTTFTPSGSYTPGFINVIRNGAQLAPANYTATNGTTVVLNNPCTAGDTIVIEVFTLTSISNALPLTGGTVTGQSTFNSGVNLAANSGNVGIGTSSPAYRLQVNASGGNGISLLGDTNNEASVLFGDSGSAVIGRITYDNSTDSMRLWTNAAERMRIDSSGNVGIGTSTPSSRLHIADGSGGGAGRIRMSCVVSSGYDSRIFQDDTGLNFSAVSDSRSLVFRTGNSDVERARVDGSGNLLVGTTSPQSSNEKMSVRQTENSDGLIVRATNASLTNVPFAVLVDRNTTNGSYVAISYYNVGAATTRFRVMDSGNVQNTNNSYGAISDLKLKQDITDATPKLAELMQVRVVNYRLNSDPTHKQIGVIAQELEQVFPGMVEESPDHDAEGNDLGTTTKAVKYSVFVPMLIKALQEQQQMIEELKAEVAALEARS